MKVALTGGIATGKSFVLDRFRRRGVACLDADLLAHGAMVAGGEAARAIADRFGPDVIAADGSVDRAKLGPIVFADAAARQALEAIIHPAVYRAMTAAVRGLERAGDVPLVVVDVPLLYETGHDTDFDRVIVTACPPEIQISRLIERGLSDESARQRLAAQWPTDRKASRADFVISTEGTFEETAAQVDGVLERLRSGA
jgi:dephospho-CoA kinase